VIRVVMILAQIDLRIFGAQSSMKCEQSGRSSYQVMISCPRSSRVPIMPVVRIASHSPRNLLM
jgi:hypothetical protein